MRFPRIFTEFLTNHSCPSKGDYRGNDYSAIQRPAGWIRSWTRLVPTMVSVPRDRNAKVSSSPSTRKMERTRRNLIIITIFPQVHSRGGSNELHPSATPNICVPVCSRFPAFSASLCNRVVCAPPSIPKRSSVIPGVLRACATRTVSYTIVRVSSGGGLLHVHVHASKASF